MNFEDFKVLEKIYNESSFFLIRLAVLPINHQLN